MSATSANRFGYTTAPSRGKRARSNYSVARRSKNKKKRLFTAGHNHRKQSAVSGSRPNRPITAKAPGIVRRNRDPNSEDKGDDRNDFRPGTVAFTNIGPLGETEPVDENNRIRQEINNNEEVKEESEQEEPQPSPDKFNEPEKHVENLSDDLSNDKKGSEENRENSDGQNDNHNDSQNDHQNDSQDDNQNDDKNQHKYSDKENISHNENAPESHEAQSPLEGVVEKQQVEKLSGKVRYSK